MSDLEREVRGRQPTAVLKLAMNFAIADWTGTEALKVKWGHVAGAISVVESLVDGLRNVGNFVYRNDDTRVLDLVRDTVRQHKSIPHSKLLRLATSRGVKNKKHFQDVIDTLVQQEQIELEVRKGERGRPGKVYKWKSGTTLRHLKHVKGDDGDEDGITEAFATNSEADDALGEGAGGGADGSEDVAGPPPAES